MISLEFQEMDQIRLVINEEITVDDSLFHCKKVFVGAGAKPILKKCLREILCLWSIKEGIQVKSIIKE